MVFIAGLNIPWDPPTPGSPSPLPSLSETRGRYIAPEDKIPALQEVWQDKKGLCDWVAECPAMDAEEHSGYRFKLAHSLLKSIYFTTYESNGDISEEFGARAILETLQRTPREQPKKRSDAPRHAKHDATRGPSKKPSSPISCDNPKNKTAKALRKQANVHKLRSKHSKPAVRHVKPKKSIVHPTARFLAKLPSLQQASPCESIVMLHSTSNPLTIPLGKPVIQHDELKLALENPANPPVHSVLSAPPKRHGKHGAKYDYYPPLRPFLPLNEACGVTEEVYAKARQAEVMRLQFESKLAIRRFENFDEQQKAEKEYRTMYQEIRPYLDGEKPVDSQEFKIANVVVKTTLPRQPRRIPVQPPKKWYPEFKNVTFGLW